MANRKNNVQKSTQKKQALVKNDSEFDDEMTEGYLGKRCS